MYYIGKIAYGLLIATISAFSLMFSLMSLLNAYDYIIFSESFHIDPQELFVPTEDYYVVVQLRTRQPALLPCQVTNPLAKVTLHREFPPEQIPVDGVKISFDQKKGFVIYQAQPSLAGSLFCIAELGNLRQMSTKYMLIYVHCKCPFLVPPSP